jgi:hypothetical protein
VGRGSTNSSIPWFIIGQWRWLKIELNNEVWIVFYRRQLDIDDNWFVSVKPGPSIKTKENHRSQDFP